MAANWKSWHKVVELRDDLRSGELSMSMFAADLHEAFMQNGKHRIYEEPKEFFSLTYPTTSLRQLAGDVCQRLAGQNDKAVRQLQLTYGGGKTHALITLLHLAREPEKLPDLPAVEEFRTAAGGVLPPARVAVLCFDKIDPVAGIEAKSPDGEMRALKYPWSILAWQIAGKEGLAIINPEHPDTERDTPPFQELLAKLLDLPAKQNMALLILIDELLMYAHVKVSADGAWRNYLTTFFQCLTQAVSQTNNCCLVASLLASDTAKEDFMGKSLQSELYDIFNRQREEAVEPVGREDVAEVLRRRFFTPDSISDPKKFRPHVQAAVKGVLDWTENANQKSLEERYSKSYPFHPDLTDIFFSKWTQIRGFQKTRGALRIFALALRDAEKWDQSPVISASVFLNIPDASNLSAAARELIIVADNADVEGPQAAWTGIVEKEMEIARLIQQSIPFKHREMEQAVMGTFLHSQPLGQDARLRDLTNLASPTQPDKINFQKGLEQWAELSFWLDDEYKSKEGQLPGTWRLGRKPNLTQMHAQAKAGISNALIEAELLKRVNSDKSFKDGASARGVAVHTMPSSPADVANDGKFHFVILPPACVSDMRKISTEAIRFLEEGASANSPRTFKNALIMVAPTKDGLDIAKNRISDALAWEQVLNEIRAKGKDAIDPARESTLLSHKKIADGKVAEAVRQAWSLGIVMAENGKPECFKISPDAETSHFNAIKKEQKARIYDTPISAEVLLPSGPYNLWAQNDKSKRVVELYQSFVKFPHLPKLLEVKNIIETVAQGCEDGVFALKLTRPDGSCRTWWKDRPDYTALNDPEMEIWLPEHIELVELKPELLLKDALPGLWPDEEDACITLEAVKNFFDGNHTITVQMKDYPETFAVPKATEEAIRESVKTAVRNGKLWLYKQPISILREEPEEYMLDDATQFYVPPKPISPMEILPTSLEGYWKDNQIAIPTLENAMSQKYAGRILPWATIKEVITSAINNSLICIDGDHSWPCEKINSSNIKLVYNSGQPNGLKEETKGCFKNASDGKDTNFELLLTLTELQDLGDEVASLKKIEIDFKTKIKVKVCLEGGDNLERTDDFINALSELLNAYSKHQ